MSKPRFSIGTIAPTEGLVDEFFNDFTGEGEDREDQVADPILETAELKSVDSPLFGGVGLDVSPEAPVPNSEVASDVDSTPVGEKRPPAKSERSVNKKTGTRCK